MSSKKDIEKAMGVVRDETGQGRMIVVSGASGTGKTTLCRQLEKEMGFFFSVSATTRPPRPGEVEGRDYRFLSAEEFDKMIREGRFLEWAEVHGQRYGTPREPIERSLQRGQDVLLDLDTQGALRLKQAHPEALLIFIKPPSVDELRKRLTARGTDSEETIRSRIERAEHEIEQSVHYDHIVVNCDLDGAKEELRSIIGSALKKRIS